MKCAQKTAIMKVAMELRDDLTIGKLLHEAALHHPDRPALMTRIKTLTYREFDQSVDLKARRLLSYGIKKGMHVGILCETSPRLITLFYALARIGAVAVMFNTSLGEAELTALINNSDTELIIVGDGYKEVSFPRVLGSIRKSCPKLKDVLYEGRHDSFGFTVVDSIEPAGEELLSAAEALVRPSDTAQILFTSGTTSSPKMVMTSHYSRANCGRFQAKDLGAVREDVFLGALPMFHCFSISVNILAACSVGACLFLPASRKTKVLLSDIRDFRCTVLSCVPALFFAMMRRPDFKEWDVSSIRIGFIGGSGCSQVQFKEIENAFGMTLLSSLGQTEATGGLTVSNITDPLELRASTVGHMMDHLEGRIADPDTGESLPAGSIGEICVRGYVVMQGYYNNPEATAKAIDKDGWLHTGDCGWMGEDGYIRLSGRIKDIIIRGGENISPAEIEEAALEDEYIDQCKAIGVPDRFYGEEACLCIIPKDGYPGSTAGLREMLARKLAPFKVPKYILVFRKFPEKNTGKVDTVKLREEAVRKLGL